MVKKKKEKAAEEEENFSTAVPEQAEENTEVQNLDVEAAAVGPDETAPETSDGEAHCMSSIVTLL